MKNRWLIALAAVGIHICIGSAYSWSVFSKPLQAAFGWSLKEANLTFGIAIFFLGMSAAVMGHFVEKRGPRVSGTVSAILWGVGLLGAGVATKIGNLWLLYLCYGVIGGMGLGTGYVTPVSTLVKWFPDRRGLATGMAIMGFGFASMIAAPIMAKLIENVGVSTTFFIMGSVYLVVMIASARYLEPPPKDWKPAGWSGAVAGKKIKEDLSNITANEAVRTKPFYGLWIMMFINITCGIAVISVASPLAQEVTGMSAIAAGAIVGLIGVFNGLGRIGWASASDYLGRPNTYIAFFAFQILAFWLLPTLSAVLIFQVVLYAIMSCYGGGFSTLPAYIGDLFGTKQISAIHGYVLTAWAMAGMIGSSFASFLREQTGSYAAMMQVFAGVFAFALIVSIAMKVYINRAHARKAASSGALAPQKA
ncbi:OFA family MFS transporter [Uliginosibacterium sp. 31-12]|uniref:L-lactate MFS transporter n=1 Tax=Uliginosibacterium sp. 31-12 TaxID=3062781 RepID=UPI0026E43C7C|nr:OFA family MFS transporter [Uliginosibacterium sp. 31-12]MDO6387363.1 OFA family MFS transporter [Uliginosibacterium sp. 31-12]